MFCTTYLQAVLTATSTRMVRRFFLLATAAIVLFFSNTLARAQSTSTGKIHGKVVNATNGASLKNATITVAGTNLEAFSDAYGEYELTNVPAGEVTVKADYIGEPQQSVSVTVAKGETAQKDFSFREAGTPQVKDGTVALDPLVVNAQRYHNAQVIAIAEERNSINIKNVVSADAFGDIPGGNVGEFVKFLPGVQVDYGAFQGAQTGYSESTPSGVSIRGFGPEDTAILIDGMPVSNASPGSLTRQVGLDMLSINNASRVELTKVATPDMPNNSVGGQINLITKSAFDYAKPTYSARVFFNVNSLNTHLEKTPGPVNKSSYKTTPGAEFSVSYPFSKNFGITVTGYAARQYDQTNRGETTTTYSGSSSIKNLVGVLALDNPALTRFKVTDIGRLIDTTSGNLKVDWRPTPGQTLSANFQYSKYNSVEAQRNLDFRPTVAAGADWNPNSFIGTTANSTTDMRVTTVDKIGDTKSAQLQYRLQHGGWNISAGASISQSTGENTDRANGHYSEIALKLNPGQVNFNNIRDGIPGSISTFNRVANGGGVRDYTLLQNYSLDGSVAKSGEAHSRNTVGLFKVDVDRAIDFIPLLGSNSLNFKIGARRDEEKTEKWGLGTGYRELLDPTKSSIYSVANILDDNYVGVSPGFGYPAQQWGSPYKLYAINQESKIFIVPGDDTTDARENWYSYVGQQKSLKESKDAAYAMLTGRFFSNRLSFIGGVRQEQNTRKGRGPYNDSKWYFAKNPDGSLYRDGGTALVDFRTATFLSNSALLARMKAAQVWYPDHLIPSAGVNPTTLEGAKMARQANRYVNQKQTGSPSPSFITSFALTKKIDLKASWSRSFGLPALEDTTYGLVSGNGNFTVIENETIPADGTLGTIQVANPGIKPSDSSNWDFQVAYYTDTGGKAAVSFFMKSVTNQAETISIYPASNPALFGEVLGALGLDSADYQDWKLTTATNSDTIQKTHGFEYEVRQDFGFLGGWGRNFQVFASYTMNSLAAPSAPVPVTITTPAGTPLVITPGVKTINLRSNRFWGAGIQFATRRFSAQIRGTYKNENEQSDKRVPLSDGNFLRRIEPAETRIDLNFNYQFSDTYSVFLSGRDVFNAEREIIIRDDKGLLPSYAQRFDTKKFGVTWTFGVNAKW